MWLENKEPDLRITTLESYKIYVLKHIIPYFKELNIKLNELKPIDIKNYYTYKYKSGRLDGKQGGLSKVSIKKHGNIIREALNEAVILELIYRNPAQNVKTSKINQSENRYIFLNHNQCNNMLKALKTHYIYGIFAVTLYYGLRRSEVLGLKWSAVNFEFNEITICHTVVKNISIVRQDTTKTSSSMRTLELLPEIKSLLFEIEQNQKMQGNYQPNGYIFKNDKGLPFRPDSITRGFQRAIIKAGFQKMRFHDLRHTTASILYDKNWSVKDIQDWLGHKDVETTLNIYTHISSDRKKSLANDMSGTFIL
jgi:integrase